MSGYKILIVEDEPSIADSLQDILELLKHEVVASAISYDEAIAGLEENEVDLVLLDIQLKGDKTGLDVAETINERFKVPYIFTTAFADEKTINTARDLGPYGYIVKPYGLKDIHAAIEIAFANHANVRGLQDQQAGFLSNNHLYIKVNTRLIRLNDDDIQYVESKGDYVLIKTAEKGYIVHSTIKNADAKLNPQKFLKVHRAYIVNLDKIRDIEDSSILIDDKSIPVSRQHKEALMKRIDLL